MLKLEGGGMAYGESKFRIKRLSRDWSLAVSRLLIMSGLFRQLLRRLVYWHGLTARICGESRMEAGDVVNLR